jgi:hypothetical protein
VEEGRTSVRSEKSKEEKRREEKRREGKCDRSADVGEKRRINGRFTHEGQFAKTMRAVRWWLVASNHSGGQIAKHGSDM